MQAERSWYLATLAGAFAILALWADAASEGEASAVRHAWAGVVAPLLSALALVGLGLATYHPRGRTIGKILAGAALGGLALQLLLAIAIPLEPTEPVMDMAVVATEILLFGALPVATVLSAQPGRARLAPLVLVLAALAVARLLHATWLDPSPARVGVTVAWAGFVVVGGRAGVRLLRHEASAQPHP